MKGQLSSCLTSSTVSCSQADSSCTPWFLPEERRLDEDEEEEEEEDEEERTGRTGLEGLGGGAASGGGAEGRGKRWSGNRVQFREVLHVNLPVPVH